MMDSYSLSQMRGLILLFFSLCIIEFCLLAIGLFDLLNERMLIALEAGVLIIIALSGATIAKKYRDVQRLYREMEEEEFKMTALIQSMPDFVCFKDGRGRWIRTNDFGISLYELEGVDYIGKTDGDLGKINPFFKEAFEYCIGSDEETWQGGVTTRSEEAFYIRSGELKTFDVIKVPIFFDNGKRKALITIGRDISQQKAAEERLVQQEKLSVAGELAAGIAHEIKNPLTSLKGFVQLMKETQSVMPNTVDVMASEIDRIHLILEEFMVLAKPQKRVEETFEFCEVMDYVLNLMKHQAGDNVQFEQNYQASCDSMLFGDRNRLIQVFINLIKNSLEAMPDGGTIEISSSSSEGHVTIHVRDTGHGMTKEQLEQVQEPFYSQKETGMGLGVTISQKIIFEHKGELTYHSRVGEGTIVTIQLPIQKSA